MPRYNLRSDDGHTWRSRGSLDAHRYGTRRLAPRLLYQLTYVLFYFYEYLYETEYTKRNDRQAHLLCRGKGYTDVAGDYPHAGCSVRYDRQRLPAGTKPQLRAEAATDKDADRRSRYAERLPQRYYQLHLCTSWYDRRPPPTTLQQPPLYARLAQRTAKTCQTDYDCVGRTTPAQSYSLRNNEQHF